MRKTSATIQRPIEIAVCRELDLKKIGRILCLLLVSQHEISIRHHLPMRVGKHSSPIMLRKIKQDISQQHQIEVRQLHQRRAQIRILKLAHGTNLRTHLPLFLTSNHVFQNHTRRQPAVNLQPSVSSLSARSSLPDQIRDDHIAQLHESSINSFGNRAGKVGRLFEDVEQRLRAVNAVALGICRPLQNPHAFQPPNCSLCRCEGDTEFAGDARGGNEGVSGQQIDDPQGGIGGLASDLSLPGSVALTKAVYGER
jgi:hypothetical protein